MTKEAPPREWEVGNQCQHAEPGHQATSASTTADPAGAAPLLLNLLHVAATLVGVLNLEKLLHTAVGRLVQALPAMHGGILWLYEPRSGKLRAAAVEGISPSSSTPDEPATTWQISPGEALAGQAFQQNEVLSVGGQNGYHNIAGYFNQPAKSFVRKITDQLPSSLLLVCIPLQCAGDASTEKGNRDLEQPFRGSGEVIGVLEVIHLAPAIRTNSHQAAATEDGEQSPLLCFDSVLTHPTCLRELCTFAGMLAASIRNAQRYEESQRHCHRLKAFDAVVTAISGAADLQDLMRRVLDVVLDMLPVSSGALLVLDRAHSWLTLGAHHGLPATYVTAVSSMPVAGAPCEEVFHYGQPVLRPLMEERGEDALLSAGLESCAYLPLLAGGTVVGVLGLYGDALLPRRIDTASLMPLSNQVGFAIANVRLYEASQIERTKLNTVINSIAEGVLLCDSAGRLVLANEAATILLKLETIPFEQPLSDMVDFYGFQTLDGRPLLVEQLPMARALSGEVFHDYRVLLRGASGANTVMSFSGAPTHDDSGAIEGAVVIFRDITASQKLERAKDEFLAVTAHELRSPLAAVRSYADMLLNRKWQTSNADPRDVRGLTILSQQVTHMLRMVDNLLDVSQLDAGRVELVLQPVNLVSLITQVLDQKRPEAGNRDLVLETDLPELAVQCDQMRIRQVLTNLVGNAIKYSPPETQIKVCLRPGETEGQPEAVIAVSDSGTPILPEQKAHLFQRFYRVGSRRRVSGLGLGLYLSREFVQMHRGRIWLETTDIQQQGNTFCFTLPLRTPSSGDEPI